MRRSGKDEGWGRNFCPGRNFRMADRAQISNCNIVFREISLRARAKEGLQAAKEIKILVRAQTLHIIGI